MVQLMFEGTIAYWFTRPVSPRRWYLIRMCGDLAYGGAWAGPTVSFFAGQRGSEGTWNTNVPTYSNGESITLYCVLPNGAGIANVNWSQ